MRIDAKSFFTRQKEYGQECNIEKVRKSNQILLEHPFLQIFPWLHDICGEIKVCNWIGFLSESLKARKASLQMIDKILNVCRMFNMRIMCQLPDLLKKGT